MRRLRWIPAGVGSACACALASCTLPGHPAPDTGAAPLWVADRPSLEVVVTDPAGAPVLDAWVVVTPGGRDAPTGADGHAVLTRLGDGAWTVRVAAPGAEPAVTTVDIAEDDVVLAVTVTPRPAPTATLRGIVTDAVGRPVAGAQLSVDGATTTTDTDGGWILTGLGAGSHTVTVAPAAGTPWVPVELGPIDLSAGTAAFVAATLAAGPPVGARFVGSSPCAVCHPTQGAAWSTSAHARASRTPAEAAVALPELDLAFTGAATIALEAGAVATLGVGVDGWQITLADAGGASTGPMPVVEVYGGNRSGAALAVERAGVALLAPVTFATAGQGASSRQHPAAVIPGYTAGWFELDGTLRSTPGPEASYALQCAGCHATGVALAETDGAYALIDSADALVSERRVGCEACHDRGGAHTQVADVTARRTTILDPGLLPPSVRVDGCARCHERSTPTAHPFADPAGWPTDAAGEAIGPLDGVAAFAEPAPERWLAVPASKVGWDQVGDFRTSPHAVGEYRGICEDCHDPHGSAHPAGLRVDPNDNTLCTTCHAAAFPDAVAEADHARHGTFAPGPWSPGACAGCHLPRTAVSVRPDAVSGAGELHSHTLTFSAPAASLAEFDAAGLDVLPYGAAPIPACLDCHLQADAAAEDVGSNCACAVGDPRLRATFEGMQNVYDIVWGAP